MVRAAAREFLAFALMFAGAGHLSFAREEFQAQVPPWLPMDPDFVVLASGVVEILIGLGLAFWPSKKRLFGWLAAGLFVAVFPGNISQLITQSDAFGLNSDLARAIRLAFQPLLILWALWSTGIINEFLRKRAYSKNKF